MMRQFLLPGFFIVSALCGCATANDPLVGTWTDNDVKIICNSDGTGIQRFDRDTFYEYNKTYEGVETKIRWKKTSQNTYTFYYLDPKQVYKDQGTIENGELVFDQGDYADRFKK
jgi:hypothetical protein